MVAAVPRVRGAVQPHQHLALVSRPWRPWGLSVLRQEDGQAGHRAGGCAERRGRLLLRGRQSSGAGPWLGLVRNASRPCTRFIPQVECTRSPVSIMPRLYVWTIPAAPASCSQLGGHSPTIGIDSKRNFRGFGGLSWSTGPARRVQCGVTQSRNFGMSEFRPSAHCSVPWTVNSIHPSTDHLLWKAQLPI
jgi:hypothetical protein